MFFRQLVFLPVVMQGADINVRRGMLRVHFQHSLVRHDRLRLIRRVVFQRNATRGGFGIYHFGTSSEDMQRRQTLRALLAMVPAKAKIVSSEIIVPQVSNRAFAYTLRMGIADADFLLFSVPPGGEERAKVMEVLPSGTFGVVAERGEFVLAQRGHSTEMNAGVLARMP